MNEVGVVFSLDQLWLLNDLIRHESDQDKTWKIPPSSKELNATVADAILACEDHGLTEYTIPISSGDTYVIDFHVRRSMKSYLGTPIGVNLLLKVFRARRELSGESMETFREPVMTPSQIEAKFIEWRNQDADRSAHNDAHDLSDYKPLVDGDLDFA